MKKIYYGFYLDCVGGVLTFETKKKTKKEAEEARKEEIEQGDEPMSETDIGEVEVVEMTDVEFENQVEV